MSEDKRAPRARVESADRDDVVEADAHVIDDETAGGQKASGGFDGSATETFRDAGKRMGGWVSRTFPGHEHASWGFSSPSSFSGLASCRRSSSP